MATSSAHQERPKPARGRPLREQVQECQSEWFEEEVEEARNGNPVSMALVGQMRMQGYGCPRNLEDGKKWVARALDVAKGKEDYAHLLAGWRALLANADKQPVLSSQHGATSAGA